MNKWKWSQWNVFYPILEMKKVLLLNTLTSAGIVLEESQFETLRIGKYDSLPDDLFIKLIGNGFLVSPQREEDENATYWRFYHNVKYRSVFGTFHLVVIPTYKCNFSCTYCFEDNNKLEKTEIIMNPQLLVDWMEKFWQSYKYNGLHVVFYGGEPLYRRELLEDYLRLLEEWCGNRRIAFSFSIITNGSIIERQFLLKMLKTGLKEIQITIDGIENIHDERRPFKYGGPSFSIVYRNLLDIINLPLKVIIRTNIDRHNISTFELFLNKLKADGIFSKGNVSFMPALVDPSPSKTEWCEKYVPKNLNERLKTLEIVWGSMVKLIEDPKFLLRSHKLSFSLCDAKVADSLIVGSDGSIYSCYSLIGTDVGKIGDIETGFNSRYAKFLFSIDEKVRRCLEERCPFVPICNGGCFYQSYIESGNPFQRVCPRNFYEKIWLPVKAKIYQKFMQNSD